MSTLTPIYDPAELAKSLGDALADHRARFAARVPPPDPRPYFFRAHDGAIVDRNGIVKRPAPQA